MQSTRLTLLFLALLTVVFSISAVDNTEAAKEKTKPAKAMEKQKSCAVCHDDLSAALPKTHPSTSGKVLSVCMECHAPEARGMAEPNTFDARIHLAHLKMPVQADCLDCHTWKPGKNLGLSGTAQSYGVISEESMAMLKQKFASAADSDFLDAFHASKGIPCTTCHGKDILGENPVENKKCLGCHGPMEELSTKTAPKDFPDRNPHKSHLGEIGCTICHSGHSESKIYCLECHPKFEMKLKAPLKR